MDSRRGWWTHWPLAVLIVGIAACAAAMWAVAPGSSTGRSVAILWGAVPAALALWQYSYTHLDRHRLWVTRMKMALTNPEVEWGLDVEFDLRPEVDAIDTFEVAKTAARSVMRPGDDVLSTDVRLFVAQVHGATVRIALDQATGQDEVQEILRVDVPISRRGWRGWQSSIDQEIPRLLEAIERAVQPTASKFVVDVCFASGNPYFGLFVNNVPETQLLRFNIEYFEHDNRQGAVIRVGRERVQVTTDSLHSSRTLSLRYLALRPVGGHQ